MKKIGNKVKAIILGLLLVVISCIILILVGNTYTLEVYGDKYVEQFDKLNISIEDESIAKYIDKSVENGVLKVKLESVSKGKTYIDISILNDDDMYIDSIYVHNFGIITINQFMGNCSGSFVIPISITIWLAYVLFLLISSYMKNLKNNMYQYKNIAYLGIIIFVIFALIAQIMSVFDYNGIIQTITGIINMFSFSIITFPIAFVISILVIISNISLIRNEGFNFRNILGIILGAFLCIFTVLPDFVYSNILYNSEFIDIHNSTGIQLYIYNSIEAFINITITYIECVLVGTIIIGVKSAIHKPKFDKDAIIILGCQIKKDGTLTNLLKGRADRAISFANMQKEKTGKDILFVPSGGKGSDEVISEGEAIEKYLLSQKIEKERILTENKSKNTFENIKFSNKLICEKINNPKIAFSTTNYHVFRAGTIATMQNIMVEGIGSKTKSYFWVNAFIREFIATLVTEKKKHIVVVGFIVLLSILMLAVTYINNIL